MASMQPFLSGHWLRLYFFLPCSSFKALMLIGANPEAILLLEDLMKIPTSILIELEVLSYRGRLLWWNRRGGLN